MRDVIFINPPNHNRVPALPIGIGYLNQILVDGGMDSAIIDIQHKVASGLLELNGDFFGEVKTLLSGAPAKIYGITVMNASYVWAVRISEIVKELFPEAVVILGGPQATLANGAILKSCKTVDFLCVYEGEKVILDFVKWVKGGGGGKPPANNIWFRNTNNEIEHPPNEPLIKDLDSLPLINFDANEYADVRNIGLDVGRGCAYDCCFCSTNQAWQRTPRFKSPGKIAAEAEYYYRNFKGTKRPTIHFEHDNFISRKDVLRDLVKIKKAHGLSFEYACSSRIDTIDDEIIELLASSACKNIFFGIETGSQRIQKIMGKNLDLKKVMPMIRKLISRKILVEVNFIIGFPEETYEEMCQTLDLMSEIQWENARVGLSIISPEPMSRLALTTPVSDYLLVKDTLFLRDMTATGIDPLALEPELHNHIYTIAGKNYDTLEVAALSTFYLHILKSAPMSMLALRKNLGVTAKDVLNDIRGYMGKGKPLSNNSDSATGFFAEAYASHLSANGSFFGEFLRYEIIRTAYINDAELTSEKTQPADFNWGFNEIYLAVLKDKELLSASASFPRRKTRIAFGKRHKNG